MSKYQALPFLPTPERAIVTHRICRGIAAHENVFTDYQRAHQPLCPDSANCQECLQRMLRVHYLLLDPQTRAWEVWDMDQPNVVGLIYLTDIIAGCDAKAHYLFFDSDLVGKTELLKQMMEWCFTEHEDWKALKRITVEVPDFAFALAKHAVLKLGFDGQFTFTSSYEQRQRHRNPRKQNNYGSKKRERTISLPVEGIKRNALRWNGRDADILILGKQNGQLRGTDTAQPAVHAAAV